MSQKRQKKQLSTLDNVETLTDHELREALKGYNQAPGPITDSTRNLYRKKLVSLIEDGGDSTRSTSLGRTSPTGHVKLGTAILADDDDDDDTSDEDYNAQDEELEEEESEEDEDEEEEGEEDEEEEDELGNELDDIKLSNITTENEHLTTSMIAGSTIFSFYLFSSNNYKLLIPSQPFKNLTKQLLILTGLTSTVGYVAFRVFRYYRLRHHQELKRVCDLVSEALELLQSPDNPSPKGLMPILHIRDTLLTPAERKTKSAVKLWAKAVKFIEEHESRVKVELVNIDGEDFRAWKWIGSRKL